VAWLRSSNPPQPEVVRAAGRLLPEAIRVLDKGVRARTLELAMVLPLDGKQVDLTSIGRELARAHLRDADPANRVRAVQLAMQPDSGLLPQVVPLLDDKAPEVRRAAMLAVGDAETVIATEDLLRWLHDPDTEVRKMCEAALCGPRKLKPKHLHVGRLLTDSEPSVRLQVLECLGEDSDLEPGVWLRLLSHDPSPAVRIAAIRAAVEYIQVDLTDRIDQMARSDPSPTVCQLARYYLSYPKHQAASPLGN